MNKLTSTILLILLTIPAFSHGSDSLRIEDLQTKIEKVEGFQDNTKDSLDNKFDKLSNGLEREKNLFWIVSGILALLGLAGIASVIAKYRKIESR